MKKEQVEHPIKAMRRASVPLAAFETSDPAATVAGIVSALNGNGKASPIISWDICQTWVGLNDAGRESLDWFDPMTMGLAESLKALGEQDADNSGLVAFMHNAQRFLERDGVAQGLWNLRDKLKAVNGIIVLLGPSLSLPAELVQDVVVVTEPLPDAEAIGVIVDGIVKDSIAAGAKIVATEYGREVVVDTLCGLSAFAAEQALAMSIGKDGVNADALWERKRRLVEQTPGLSIWKGSESFDSLGGLANIKDYLRRILTSGKTPVRAIGFIDEIEKGFAGAGGDLSGVSQDQLGVFLKTMQDFEIPGIILVGPPGTGKSAIAKGAGGVSGAEVLTIDTGAMTGSLVGESQRKIRAAMETFKAVARGKGLFIATCNKLSALPPELKRRFTLGTFFVDLPSAEERAVIWPLWIKKFGLSKEQSETSVVNADGWTGAEIKACCEVAYRTGSTLLEASDYIVPVCRSAAESIETLRKGAAGKFISANYAGTYKVPTSAESAVKRAMAF